MTSALSCVIISVLNVRHLCSQPMPTGSVIIMETEKQSTSDEATLPVHHRICHLPLDKTYCSENADALEETLQELNELFSAVGVDITVLDHTLTIDINEEKFSSVTTRKAGRKKNNLSKRYEEIMEYRETHTAGETFQWLGLTKQTYYRRMKEMREES